MTTNETEMRAVVESLLQDTYAQYISLKNERDEYQSAWTKSSIDMATGKIRAWRLVLDAFAEAGFDIGGGR